MLTNTKQKLETTHKECLGIEWAIMLPLPYLGSSRFSIRTDHKFLKLFLAAAGASDKLARWCLRLLELDLQMVNRAGSKHQTPDALSRLKKWDREGQLRRRATGTHNG